jgi:soluble lytic murein transglycosylase-like protein
MEKRLKKTLARTLNWGSICAKLGLTAVLFIPPILTLKYRVPPVVKSSTQRIPVQVTKLVEKPQPKELVKIYSIVKSNRPAIADKEAWKLSTVILGESATRNLDPMLVLAVIKVESGFRNQALSPVGARGIMQIMPETGRHLSAELFRVDGFENRNFRPHHLDDPAFNIKLGVYYLDGLKKQFRNLSLALLAYNLGPGEVQNRLENNLHFSDDYASVVLTAYREYKKVKAPAF